MTDFSSKLPVWYQLAMMLRADILSGALAPGCRIEPEVQLAERHGVSVMPVRQALRSLEDEGLITRQRGRGTFVTDRPPPSPGSTSLEALYSREFRRKAKVLERGRTAIPVAFRTAFAGITELSFLRRLAYRAGEPWSYGTLYFLPEFDARIANDLLQRYPLYRIMAEQCGVRLERSTFEVSARNATPDVAEHLGVDAFAPLLDLSAISYDSTGRAVGAFQMAFLGAPNIVSFETLHGAEA